HFWWIRCNNCVVRCARRPGLNGAANACGGKRCEPTFTRMPWSLCGTSWKACITACTDRLRPWRRILVKQPLHPEHICHFVPYPWRSATQVEVKRSKGAYLASIQEHSVILTAQRKPFYNREKRNPSPMVKDFRWA